MTNLKAIDIANFFVQLSNRLPESEITNLKLNKLCYYAQGWSLVKLGEPLFDEEVQAWEFGPVIPSVYHTYKVCGKSPIEEPADDFSEEKLDNDKLLLLVDVYTTYGKFTPIELVTMTHKPGSPWRDVYQERENRVISKSSIKDYFTKYEKLEGFVPNVTESNTVVCR